MRNTHILEEDLFSPIRSGCPRTAHFRSRAFSLIEVALAIGIVSFALLTVLALLPLGIMSNRVSVEETRAAFILTELEADLRNTHPLAASGKSARFGLNLPYAFSGGRLVFAPVETNSLAAGYTKGLTEEEKPTVADLSARYRASVIYTRVPTVGELAPIEARLIVNWPCVPADEVADLTGNPVGYLETYVTFSAP